MQKRFFYDRGQHFNNVLQFGLYHLLTLIGCKAKIFFAFARC